MKRRLAAGLIALATLGAPAGAADGPLSLAALNPNEISTATGAARQLDLGTLEVTPPSGAEMLQATYDIHVGGFHLATIDLVALVDKGHYVAGTLLSTKGLADAFVSSNIQAVSTGEVQGHLVVPHTYNSDLKSTEKRQLLGLLFGKDGPAAIDSNPPYDLKRFPVSPELKQKTVDPLSAALFIALGSSADDKAKCGSTVPIFDGKRRYNLTLSYIHDDSISLGRDSFNKGKPVPALMCRAVYERIAGFKPSKKKSAGVPPIDVWLAPFPGTDFMVPVRMQANSYFGGIVARAVKLNVVPPGNKT